MNLEPLAQKLNCIFYKLIEFRIIVKFPTSLFFHVKHVVHEAHLVTWNMKILQICFCESYFEGSSFKDVIKTIIKSEFLKPNSETKLKSVKVLA